MYEHAKITGYKQTKEGAYLQVLIPGKNLNSLISGKQIRDCNLWLEDGRYISAEQRKKAYATISDIAAFTGEAPEAMKEWLKYLHICQTGVSYFSLSTCRRDTAREFINTMLDYSLEMGIPLMDYGVNRTDDINRYLYACLRNRKCAVCGRQGEIHHEDTIGMGNDRNEVDDSRHRKICLCRKHHSQAHTIGRKRFRDMYHIYGIIFDAAL